MAYGRSNNIQIFTNDTTLTITSQNNSLAKKIRLLFMARRIERSLASYEKVGWEEEYSKPKRKPWNYLTRLPTTTGGPIMICLDTSWSMNGPRELLAKAVVFESVVLATKQRRSCYVLTFSGRGNVAVCDLTLHSTNSPCTSKPLSSSSLRKRCIISFGIGGVGSSPSVTKRISEDAHSNVFSIRNNAWFRGFVMSVPP